MLSFMALGHFWAILKKLLIYQWYKRMYLWAKAPEIVKNEKPQCEVDEWSESSIESDLGMWFPISSLYLAFNDFAFFKHSFYRKRRLLKRVPYLFIFVMWENEILIAVIRDSLFFLFVNRARDSDDSDVTYCKRRSYSSGGETMDEIICEEQWLVLTKELITADVERTKPKRINLQSGIPTLKRQSGESKQLI